MADRMPRPPQVVWETGRERYVISYMEKLCDAIDRTVREQEIKIHRLEQELERLKKEDDQK